MYAVYTLLSSKSRVSDVGYFDRKRNIYSNRNIKQLIFDFLSCFLERKGKLPKILENRYKLEDNILPTFGHNRFLNAIISNQK